MTARESPVVNDVTQLNPVRVKAIIEPTTTAEVSEALRASTGPVSIGGGRYSMGGQVASPGSLHLDLRRMNRILAFSPVEATIRVQAGVRWRDIQQHVDAHDLAVKVMQTYANFTVGGAVSVNCHGRYVGLGPVVLSVRALELVLADGAVVRASPAERRDLFFGAIGGYGALGVITEIELDLATNRRVLQTAQVMPVARYWEHFKEAVRGNPRAVFHNADLYPPHFGTVRAVTWVETDLPATSRHRLQPVRRHYPLHRYLLWVVSESPLGKLRRERLIDPLLFLRRRVHWRNFEAGYDVAELEPASRTDRTYVLQEYFVPVHRLVEFVPRMAEILQRHRVNALNISIRHAMPDEHTSLSWAPVETFAFVLYHKQRTRANARARVAVWTRELIDAALAVGGRYYLPYQPHATVAQFHAAYPRAAEFFALKGRVDPHFRFANALWDKYYRAWLDQATVAARPGRAAGDFHRVFGDVVLSDAFYRFLQNVFRILPEDRLHHLIAESCARQEDEESVYRDIQRSLPSATPALSGLRFALPSLVRQKREMARQTVTALRPRARFDGYAEIGSQGRYCRSLASRLDITGPVYLIDVRPPTLAIPEILERGQVRALGRHRPLADYAPIPEESIATASLDLVTCYVGLHHMTPDRVVPFLRSVHRILRPGGSFILRDHDVADEDLRALVALAHTVFNAGLGESWETNRAELRYFASVAEWVRRLGEAGFADSGQRILQANDPTANTLLMFTRTP